MSPLATTLRGPSLRGSQGGIVPASADVKNGPTVEKNDVGQMEIAVATADAPDSGAILKCFLRTTKLPFDRCRERSNVALEEHIRLTDRRDD